MIILSAIEKPSDIKDRTEIIVMLDTQLILANYGMPALLKLKPSNLININKKKFAESGMLQKLQSEAGHFACKTFILYENQNMVNLLVYNEEYMITVLESEDNKHYLRSAGYDIQGDCLNNILSKLKSKLEQYHTQDRREATCFPHEIGILLGYPLRDVVDFVRYGGKNYLLSGCWKVYHDPEKALKIFEKFWNVRESAVRGLREGRNLKDLFL